MWANAQRDGSPAKYRWRSLFNAAKYGWHPLLECHAVILPRCETSWNLQGCPKLTKRSQPPACQSSPYYGDPGHVEEILYDSQRLLFDPRGGFSGSSYPRRYCCLTSFFLIVNTCLSCEDIARQSCVIVPRWRFFASFLRPAFPASCV